MKTFTKLAMLTLAVWLLSLFNTKAQQAPIWKWAKGAGNDTTETFATACDKNGNTILAGDFMASSAKFGSYTLPRTGSITAFLVKYDSSGTVLWAKSSIGDDVDNITSLATDKDGNIYAWGLSGSSSLKFGSVTLAKPQAYLNQMFLIKFDKNGNALWGKNVLGLDLDSPDEIAVDDLGNVFVAGILASTSASFGSGSGGTISGNGNTLFLAKYNSSGTFQWVKGSSGGTYDIANGLSEDGNGNCYLLGSFSDGTFKMGSTTLSAQDGGCMLLKFSSSGSISWARQIKDVGSGRVDDVAADKNGNVWVGGDVDGNGKLIFGTDTISNNGTAQLFVLKYDDGGNPKWMKTVEVNGSTTIDRIANDGFGYLWIAGTFFYDVDSLKFGNSGLLVNSSYRNLYVAKYDPNGEALWGVQSKLTGDAQQYIAGFGVDNLGRASVGGIFSGGKITFGSTSLTTNSTQFENRAFVARIAADQLSGISTVHPNISFSIYPNPAAKDIVVSIEHNRPFKLALFDVMGREVLASSKERIDVSELNPGTYYYQIEVDGAFGILSGKIIVE